MICQLPWQTPRCGDVFSGPRMECIEGAVRSYGYPQRYQHGYVDDDTSTVTIDMDMDTISE